jgi:hypothetical protein
VTYSAANNQLTNRGTLTWTVNYGLASMHTHILPGDPPYEHEGAIAQHHGRNEGKDSDEEILETRRAFRQFLQHNLEQSYPAGCIGETYE